MDPKIAQLVDAVGSKNREESKAAVKTLIVLGDAVVPSLVEAMQDDPRSFIPNYRRVNRTKERQQKISALLRKIGTHTSVEHLVALLGSPNPHARALACRELSEMKRTLQYLKLYDGVTERLVAILETAEDRPTLEAAAFALARIGDDIVIPRLLSAVVDAHKNVQKQMAEGFRAAGQSAALDSLVNVLQSPGASDAVRRLAARTLKHMGMRDSLPATEGSATEG
jgi:HEAT repeat protein